jgi:uncharacterized membrane protein YidH (DUF202 family)
MKFLAIALVILGIIALVYGGFSYNRQTTILDIGDVKATSTERKTVPIAPIVGGLVLVAGVALLLAPRLRRA